MRIWNGYTGKIEEAREFRQEYAQPEFQVPPWTLGDAPANAPSVPAIADFLGVPVRWVIIAGVVLFVLPYLFSRAK
jgi:hypothetical protein